MTETKVKLLDDEALESCRSLIGCTLEQLWALINVETAGCGFNNDQSVRCLFERHHFSRLTGGKFDKDNPGLSNPKPGGYKGGIAENARLAAAMKLDVSAALQSASYGLGQIMGFNYSLAGFKSAEEMWLAFSLSEASQLEGVSNMMIAAGISSSLTAGDWQEVALKWNGKAYRKNRYDEKLASEHEALKKNGCPSLKIRTAQILLLFNGFHPGKIDGLLGPRTKKAAMNAKNADICAMLSLPLPEQALHESRRE